jgi:hypothetical protein
MSVGSYGLDSLVSSGSGCMDAVPVAATQQQQDAFVLGGSRLNRTKLSTSAGRLSLIIFVRDCFNLFR